MTKVCCTPKHERPLSAYQVDPVLSSAEFGIGGPYQPVALPAGPQPKCEEVADPTPGTGKPLSHVKGGFTEKFSGI